MRGASAPPLSPPLLPRLLCIQIHLPPNQTPQNDGSRQTRGSVRAEQWDFGPVCAQMASLDKRWSCADWSVGTLLSAPTCAPLMPRFFAQCGPTNAARAAVKTF